MSDRALLFLISAAALIGALGAAIWLVLTGQTGTFDGNFLLVACLVVSAAFGLYLRFLIRNAMERQAPKPTPQAAKKTTATPEPVGKA